jgi:hypothetical protein
MKNNSHRWLGKALNYACTFALGALPLYWIFLRMRPDTFQHWLKRTVPVDIQWETVQGWQLESVWWLSLLGFGVLCACLYTLRPVLRQFSQGLFFDLNNSLRLRRLSRLLFLQAAGVSPVLTSAAGVLLSWNHPPGQRLLAVSVSSDTFQLILMSGVMLIVSEILVEGCALAEENQQFI